jgi:hypothetical protein
MGGCWRACRRQLTPGCIEYERFDVRSADIYAGQELLQEVGTPGEIESSGLV